MLENANNFEEYLTNTFGSDVTDTSTYTLHEGVTYDDASYSVYGPNLSASKLCNISTYSSTSAEYKTSGNYKNKYVIGPFSLNYTSSSYVTIGSSISLTVSGKSSALTVGNGWCFGNSSGSTYTTLPSSTTSFYIILNYDSDITRSN